jgi:malate dehydrogenase
MVDTMRSKVTVVGAGNVGATLGQRIAERDYADVVLVDVIEDMPEGKALDLLEAGPVLGYDSLVTGVSSKRDGYGATANSDIVVITSGIARKPGMSRDDLVRTNQGIVTEVTQEIMKASPNTILICVTNPLDAMVQLAYKISRLPKQRVIGMAGVLDTARFRSFIAQELHVSVRDVQAFVLGGHGDTMVPLARLSTVAGVPLPELLPAARLEQIVQRTRDGGAEIVNLLKTGSAFYAPSAAVLQMVDSILLDKKMIMPCSTYLEGEYSIHGLFVGVPVKLGASGVLEVIQLDLTTDERAQLQKSADSVRELIGVMGI